MEKYSFKIMLLTLIFGLMSSTPVQAKVYKCKNEKGQLRYQDKPCQPLAKELHTNSELYFVKGSAHRNGNSLVLTAGLAVQEDAETLSVYFFPNEVSFHEKKAAKEGRLDWVSSKVGAGYAHVIVKLDRPIVSMTAVTAMRTSIYGVMSDPELAWTVDHVGPALKEALTLFELNKKAQPQLLRFKTTEVSPDITWKFDGRIPFYK